MAKDNNSIPPRQNEEEVPAKRAEERSKNRFIIYVHNNIHFYDGAGYRLRRYARRAPAIGFADTPPPGRYRLRRYTAMLPLSYLLC